MTDKVPDMDRVRFVTHRSQRIMVFDGTGCSAQELTDLIDRVPALVTKEPPNSVLLLADFTGSEFERETVEHLKIAAVFDRPHIRKSAWVVNSNLPLTLLESIRTFSARQIPTFETQEEALEFLASDSAELRCAG